MSDRLRWWLALVLGLAVLPFACIARSRSAPSPALRIHVFSDMDRQPRYGPQKANPLFADGRAMRPPVEGTIAQGELQEDPVRATGLVDGAWAERFPLPVDRELLERGRERYAIHCAPCHGLAGYGDGPVSRRAEQRQEASWVPPPSFHDEPVRSRPVGHLFNTISRGIRTMPAYGPRIPLQDRWAIVAYLRALQRSQRASLADVPAEARAELEAQP